MSSARSEGVLPSESTIVSATPAGIADAPAHDEYEVSGLASPRVSSPGRDAWRRFRRNSAAMVSLAVIIVLTLMAIFAPFVHTTGPLTPDFLNIDGAPSGNHWFGVDGLGRDIYSRLAYGLRVPLMVGLIGTAITVAIGTGIGLIAGYFGGVVDSLLSRLTDIFFAFPAFLLALLSVSLFGTELDPYFGGTGRVLILVIVFSLVTWPPLTRFVRSLSLTLKEQQYVEAARTAGSSNMKIIRRHLLPNMFGLILVQAALITVGIVYTETTLSLFNLGVEPPNPDLGSILYDGASNLNTAAPAGVFCEVIFTAVLLSVLLLAFTFVGDGVRDAVDPRMNA